MKTIPYHLFQATKDGFVFILGKLLEDGSVHFSKSFGCIGKNDIVLILEQKQIFCKFLVLTGKNVGKVGWNYKMYFNNKDEFKEVEVK